MKAVKRQPLDKCEAALSRVAADTTERFWVRIKPITKNGKVIKAVPVTRRYVVIESYLGHRETYSVGRANVNLVRYAETMPNGRIKYEPTGTVYTRPEFERRMSERLKKLFTL